MIRGVFGRDLPPGCQVSDIPGNRPEDAAWENIYEGFWDKERLTQTHAGIRITEEEYTKMDKLYNNRVPRGNLSELIDDYISAAIEYGMEIGNKEAKDNSEENKFYNRLAVEHAFEDAKDKDEALIKVLDYLGLKGS